ncbi:methyl-accepting chemotaxis protein [Tundrisphaera lichenicola]|uniref:methyl-accepting chemotaxis protein n=1 Tax=Tundrisphaera lichenicola TaxID=2029860 RepID=UPI003EBDEF3B
MSIGKKIALGFGSSLVILSVVGGIDYQCTLGLIESRDRVRHSYQVLEALDDLSCRLTDASCRESLFLLSGRGALLEAHREGRPGVDGTLDRLRDLVGDDPGQLALVGELAPLIAAWYEEADRLMGRRSTEGAEAAASLIEQAESAPQLPRFRELVDQARAAEKRLLDRRQEAEQMTSSRAISSVVYGISIAAALISLIAYLTIRGITRSVHALVEGTEQIGGGQFEHRIVIAARDEFGKLARAFNRMAESLRTTMVRAEAEAAIRARAEAILRSVRHAVGQLSQATAEILAGTAQQAAGMQEQAAAVTQAVNTVDEVAQTASQAAQRARDVGDAAQRNLEIGQAGRAAIEGSIAALDRLNGQVEATAEGILTLAEQAQAIGEIIASVGDIAEQTNLLALNAAIEASRAGEHGRGFAVVAGEVKTLADQSKKATARVRQILSEVQKATNAAVVSTEEVTKGVAAAIRVGGQTGETINALADTLADAARAASQIVASAGQQATGMAQIGQAMRNLDRISRQNLVATRQVEQAARNLDTLGHQLAGLGQE